MNIQETAAAFAGHCEGCDGPIKVGEPIVLVRYDETWMHKECPEREQPARPVCGSCFMEIANNGVCSC